ncbi:hypothetical protein HYW44_00020 [Candidatus Daviesbacteria bacterium]|nr:hypothetical protein [Candidatus Daviesbacteria bacterium]
MAVEYKDANIARDFAEIERLRVGFHQEYSIRAGKRGIEFLNGQLDRVDLGIVTTEEGRRFKAVFGSFDYDARNVEDPDQPRTFRENKSWVLGVGELPIGSQVSGDPLRYRPVAYAADLARLPNGLVGPLVEHVRGVNATRSGLAV